MMAVLDKIKSFFKRLKLEAKGTEKKTVPATKAAEAPEKRVGESSK